jgi:hypothetical protein
MRYEWWLERGSTDHRHALRRSPRTGVYLSIAEVAANTSALL